MKRTTPTPDLFAGQPTPTSTPKFTPAAPRTDAELAQLRAQAWEHAPAHVRGVIRGVNCLNIGCNWPPVASMSSEEILECFANA